MAPTTTSLSRRGGSPRRSSADLALARTWLGAVTAAMLVVGCLFPEPPEYHRQKTPPILSDPSPSINDLQKYVPGGDKVHFNVNVLSEDDGEDIFGYLFMNYRPNDSKGVAEQQVGHRRLLAATWQDGPRLLSFEWTVSRTTGICAPMSLLVAHESSFDNTSTIKLPLPSAGSDLQMVTWWVAIIEDQDSVVSCPRNPGDAP